MGELIGEGGAADFGGETVGAELLEEFAMDFEIVGKAGGELAKFQETEGGVALWPGDEGGQPPALAGSGEGGGAPEKGGGNIVVVSLIRGGGTGESDEMVGRGVGGGIGEETVSEGDDGEFGVVFEEGGEQGFEEGRVGGVAGYAVEEDGVGGGGAVGGMAEAGDEEPAVAMGRGEGEGLAGEKDGLGEFFLGEEVLRDVKEMFATGDRDAGPARREEEVERVDARDFLVVAIEAENGEGAAEVGVGEQQEQE